MSLFAGASGVAVFLFAGAHAAQQEKVKMDSVAFEQEFRRAMAGYGGEYVQARDKILRMSAEDPVAAAALLRPHTSSPAWEERLTAAILAGWISHPKEFRTATEYLKRDLPGPRPVTGYIPAVRGQAIASIGALITPRVLRDVIEGSRI